MTAFDYSALVTKAQALIERFGQLVTLTTRTVSAIDGVAGTVTSASTTATAYAVLFDYGLQDSGKAFAKDVVIETGDKRCIIAGVTPTLDSTVTIGAVVYRVVNVKELNPGGTSLYYELHLRK
jgi:hypothetical protein